MELYKSKVLQFTVLQSERNIPQEKFEKHYKIKSRMTQRCNLTLAKPKYILNQIIFIDIGRKHLIYLHLGM